MLIEALSGGDAKAQNSAAAILKTRRDSETITLLIVYLKTEKPVLGIGPQILITLGEPVVEPLLSSLNDPQNQENEIFREKAFQVLGTLKDSRAVPVLLKSLREKEGKVPPAAARALMKIGGEQAIHGLIECLNCEEPRSRALSAKALGELGARSAVPKLVAMLRDADGMAASEAAQALGKLRDASSIPLITAFLRENENPAAQELGLAILGGFGDRALDPLADLFWSKKRALRTGAAITLGKMSENRYAGYYVNDAARASGVVIQYLESAGSADLGFEDRIQILAGLKDPRSVPLMLKSLAKRNEWVSKYAGYQEAPEHFILAFSQKGAESIEPLVAGLSDPATNVRIGAASGFIYLSAPKEAAQRAVKPLIRFLQDPAPAAKKSAVRALGALKDPAAINALLLVLENRKAEKTSRLAAAAALKRFKDPRVEEAFANIRGDESEDGDLIVFVMNGKEALDAAKERQASLVRQLSSDDRREQTSAAAALALTGRPGAKKYLFTGLGDADRAVRLAAVRGLTALRGPEGSESIDLLVKRLQHEPDPEIRHAIIAALATKKEYLTAAPFTEILGDKDAKEEVKSFASDVLAELKSEEAAEALEGRKP